jgi:small nuclear ribonucleoprotein (snRNP)-like protein
MFITIEQIQGKNLHIINKSMVVQMTLFDDELGKWIGKNIIVIMSDGKKFRGTLLNHDSKMLILEGVLELSEKLQWVKPIIHNTVSNSIFSANDVVDQSDREYLDTVLVNTRHIIRIWPYNPHKVE